MEAKVIYEASYLDCKGTPLMEKGYNGVFEEPAAKEKSRNLSGRKSDFCKNGGDISVKLYL